MKSLQSFSGAELALSVLLTTLVTTLAPTSAFATTVEGKWPTDQEPKPVQVESNTTKPKQTATPQQRHRAPAPASTQIQKPVENNKTAAYMGLGIDILSESVVAQMPAGASTGEGIIVTRFANDSPAKKSGLLVHDILLGYDQTKVVHPKQFIDLVRKDQPGRVVQLRVIRNGKVITHPVTLGMQNVPQTPNASGALNARNGLVIKQLGKNLYQANIRFTDANGKKQLRQYKGTREQIYYQAMNARDLPEKDRQQVLYAAGGPNKKQSNNNWGSFFPFGNKGNNGSFFPFGNQNNGNNSNSRLGSFFPFSR